jgi:hypothetical protein
MARIKCKHHPICAGRPINHTCSKRNKCYEIDPIITKLSEFKPFICHTIPACKSAFEDLIKEVNKLITRMNEFEQKIKIYENTKKSRN